MKNLSYDAISLLLWLKDEAVDLEEFQAYPSGLDAQSYLPMSFKAQHVAIKELEAAEVISTQMVGNTLFYQVDVGCHESLAPQLDIYDGSEIFTDENLIITEETAV